MSSTIIPIAGTLSGCIGCMYFVESIAKEEPGSMNLMTFSTFLFISFEGLIFTSKFFSVPNNIPINCRIVQYIRFGSNTDNFIPLATAIIGYLPTVITFFLVNVINNQALNFHVPVPLHIIFRSGSLLASLIMSKLLQRRHYSPRKYAAVMMITIGIIICTLATSSQKKSIGIDAAEAALHYKEWLIGIGMLITALLASAYLAICQERMYKEYGKHTREAMFVVHFASLPFFAFMGNDIYKYMVIFTQSSPIQLLFLNIPHMWALLAAMCILQWVCIRFVYRLNAEVESLTVTLVVTLRKFLSLLVSIIWFKNPFTLQHWIGAILVFSGTLAFADIWGERTKKQTNEKKTQ